MSIVIHSGQGHVVRTSRNLRGLISYAKDNQATWVEATRQPLEHGGKIEMYVAFEDGATCRAQFADWYVLKLFAAKRARRWGLAPMWTDVNREVYHLTDELARRQHR